MPPIVRVASFSISLDGFGAGPGQSLEHPMGRGGMALHQWAFGTRTFQQTVLGRDAGETGVDDGFMARGFAGVGAWVLGRNMFSPYRGRWEDHDWSGWWGDEPPYHCPVFVVTHHARPPLEMQGGTVFHFVTDGLEVAVARAREAASGEDVRIGGGVATVRAVMRAGVIDEVHLAVAPMVLGRGESLFGDFDLVSLGYRVAEHVPSAAVTHLVLRRDQPSASATPPQAR